MQNTLIDAGPLIALFDKIDSDYAIYRTKDKQAFTNLLAPYLSQRK